MGYFIFLFREYSRTRRQIYELFYLPRVKSHLLCILNGIDLAMDETMILFWNPKTEFRGSQTNRAMKSIEEANREAVAVYIQLAGCYDTQAASLPIFIELFKLHQMLSISLTLDTANPLSSKRHDHLEKQFHCPH